jgi:hypothetical protein
MIILIFKLTYRLFCFLDGNLRRDALLICDCDCRHRRSTNGTGTVLSEPRGKAPFAKGVYARHRGCRQFDRVQADGAHAIFLPGSQRGKGTPECTC